MKSIVGLGIFLILGKYFSGISPRFVFIVYLFFLLTTRQVSVQAAELTNPGDYSGSGDWDGTSPEMT